MAARVAEPMVRAAALSREEVRERGAAALAALAFLASTLAWGYYGTAPFMDGLFFTAVTSTLVSLLAYVSLGHNLTIGGRVDTVWVMWRP